MRIRSQELTGRPFVVSCASSGSSACTRAITPSVMPKILWTGIPSSSRSLRAPLATTTPRAFARSTRPAAIAARRVDLANARGVVVASGARKLRELLGIPVHNIFGITEGVIALVHAEDPLEAQDTTNGRPVSS